MRDAAHFSQLRERKSDYFNEKLGRLHIVVNKQAAELQELQRQDEKIKMLETTTNNTRNSPRINNPDHHGCKHTTAVPNSPASTAG
ncbi:unnamed protein product [Clavelina lepadiformis]|uniref:Uncharacterized protein n=1 Tax=Clavelina lepadiformis TaxID=159417 RepID=A0ABP0G696_CLALP